MLEMQINNYTFDAAKPLKSKAIVVDYLFLRQSTAGAFFAEDSLLAPQRS